MQRKGGGGGVCAILRNARGFGGRMVLAQVKPRSLFHRFAKIGVEKRYCIGAGVNNKQLKYKAILIWICGVVGESRWLVWLQTWAVTS